MRIQSVSSYSATNPSFGKIKDLKARQALTKFFLPADDADDCVGAFDTVKGYVVYTSPEDNLTHIKLNTPYFVENPDVDKKLYVDTLREAFVSRITHKLQQRPKKESDYILTKKKQVMGCYSVSIQMAQEEFFREHPDIDRISHNPPPEDLFEKWRERASQWM